MKDKYIMVEEVNNRKFNEKINQLFREGYVLSGTIMIHNGKYNQMMELKSPGYETK